MRPFVRSFRKIFGDRAYGCVRCFRNDVEYRWRCLVARVRTYALHRAALRYHARSVGLARDGSRESVIVSFTSYPERIRLKGVVEGTALSLLRQSAKADMVVLWLAKEAFPNGVNDLPEGLRHLAENGLTIRFCEEMRSYKKLIPTLCEWPTAIVVTADDDVYYPEDWLKGLLEKHNEYPNDVIAYVGRRIVLKGDGAFAPYENWAGLGFGGTSVLNLPTGVGGVLYPPQAWSSKILDYALAKELAPFGDDLFFHLCCVLNETKITAATLRGMLMDLIPDMAAAPHLCSDNLGQGRNDTAIKKIAQAFPEYLARLQEGL